MVRIINPPNGQPIVERRGLDTLSAVGADGETVETLKRLDGIVANQPQDGFISAAEIEAGLQSPHADVLSAQEVNALQGARSLLEVRLAAPTMSPFTPIPSLASLSTKKAVQPKIAQRTTFDPTTPVKIDLGTAFGSGGYVARYLFPHRPILHRVQRVANADGDSATVSIRDMERALQTHGNSFTPREKKQIHENIEKLTAWGASRQKAPLVPTAQIGSALNASTHSTAQQVAQLGAISIDFKSQTNATYDDASGTVVFERQRTHTITVPQGTMAVVNPGLEGPGELAEHPKTQRVLSAGTHELPVWEFRQSFEVQTWRDGAIVRTDKVDLSESAATPPDDLQRRQDAIAAANDTLSPGTIGHHLDVKAAQELDDRHEVGGLRGFQVVIDGVEQPTDYARLGVKAGVFESYGLRLHSQGDKGPSHLELPDGERVLLDNLPAGPIPQLGVEVDLPEPHRAGLAQTLRQLQCPKDLPSGPVALAVRKGRDGVPSLMVRVGEPDDPSWFAVSKSMKQIGA